MLGPTLKSVDTVDKTDEVVSVVNTLNAFLQSSPDIAPGASKFDAIFNAVASGNYATIFVYRWYDESVPNDLKVRLEIGFADTEGGAVDASAVANAGAADFTDAAGPIYRCPNPSSVIPEEAMISAAPGDLSLANAASTNTYSLSGARQLCRRLLCYGGTHLQS